MTQNARLAHWLPTTNDADPGEAVVVLQPSGVGQVIPTAFQAGTGGGSGGGIPEAPIDTKQYARQDAAWSQVAAPAAPTAATTTFAPGGNLTAVNVQTAIAELDAEKVKLSGDTMTGVLVVPAGSSGSPSLAFTGATNYGLSCVANVLQVSAAGTVRITLSTSLLTSTLPIKMATYTVSTLPAAAAGNAGARAYVTDANAATFNTTVAAGGSNKVPVFSDGSAWKIG